MNPVPYDERKVAGFSLNNALFSGEPVKPGSVDNASRVGSPIQAVIHNPVGVEILPET